MTDAGTPAVTAVGRLSQLDQSAKARLEAACGFINEEIGQVRRNLAIGGLACLVLGSIASAILWRNGFHDLRFPVIGSVMAFMAYGGYQYRALDRTYKQVVVGRIVAALGKGLSYSAAAQCTKQQFLDMDMFVRKTEDWHAEDEVCGHKNAVAFSMFEAKATRTEGSGKSRHTVIIFKGQIVKLDFNKNFQGQTIVVPDSDSHILGGLLGESESRGSKEICRMDSVAFEETFSVYSTDQQEARYVLTPKMMELLMMTHARFGAAHCCFQDSSLFIAIPCRTDRFEVKLFGPKMTPDSAVAELAECVELAERLIDTLDLETRIWTKV